MNALVGRLPYLLPLVIFLALAGYFWAGLGEDPHALPSALIDRHVADFDLPPIEGRERGFSSRDLVGQVSLVNVFGSWCVSCQAEHSFWMHVKREGKVPIYGIDWREKSTADGPAWLARHGDPYTLVGDDPNSRAAIAFGVTGAPETFVVDATGVIRYKVAGPVTPEIWEKTLWPIIRQLQQG